MNTISGLFEDIEDPPIRYGFIVICSDSVAFGFSEEVVFFLFRVVLNNMVTGFHFAFDLVDQFVYF